MMSKLKTVLKQITFLNENNMIWQIIWVLNSFEFHHSHCPVLIRFLCPRPCPSLASIQLFSGTTLLEEVVAHWREVILQIFMLWALCLNGVNLPNPPCKPNHLWAPFRSWTSTDAFPTLELYSFSFHKTPPTCRMLLCGPRSTASRVQIPLDLPLLPSPSRIFYEYDPLHTSRKFCRYFNSIIVPFVFASLSTCRHLVAIPPHFAPPENLAFSNQSLRTGFNRWICTLRWSDCVESAFLVRVGSANYQLEAAAALPVRYKRSVAAFFQEHWPPASRMSKRLSKHVLAHDRKNCVTNSSQMGKGWLYLIPILSFSEQLLLLELDSVCKLEFSIVHWEPTNVGLASLAYLLPARSLQLGNAVNPRVGVP